MSPSRAGTCGTGSLIFYPTDGRQFEVDEILPFQFFDILRASRSRMTAVSRPARTYSSSVPPGISPRQNFADSSKGRSLFLDHSVRGRFGGKAFVFVVYRH